MEVGSILLLPACSARPLRVAILSLPACTDFRTIANGLCIHSLPPSCLASPMRVAILVTSRMRRRLTFMTALSGTRALIGAHHLGISFRNDNQRKLATGHAPFVQADTRTRRDSSLSNGLVLASLTWRLTSMTAFRAYPQQ